MATGVNLAMRNVRIAQAQVKAIQQMKRGTPAPVAAASMARSIRSPSKSSSGKAPGAALNTLLNRFEPGFLPFMPVMPRGTYGAIDGLVFNGLLPGGVRPSDLKARALRDREVAAGMVTLDRLDSAISVQQARQDAIAAGVSPSAVESITSPPSDSSGGFLDNMFKDSGKLAIGVVIGVIAFALLKR